MEIIKKIIMWIRAFFEWLFGKKKKKKKTNMNSNPLEKKDNSKNNSSYSNDTLPSYMIISDQDKLVLLNNIQKVKKQLKDDSFKKREIAKIIALISNFTATDQIEEYLNKQDFGKINNTKLDTLLGNIDIKVKKDVYNIIDEYQRNGSIIKETIHNLDEITNFVKHNDISYLTSNLIVDEIQNIPVNENVDVETALFDKNIFDKIKNWDKKIVDDVKLEYEKVNYVTMSTVMIDKIIKKYQKIEEDYRNHRYNKLYYEKELNKIKEQIDYLKKIKNSSSVYNEITRLKKELYTKSKDKYDILYNNEIFMDIDKKCDELLGRVNQKVIDIKKKENEKQDENKKDKMKEEYLKRILLRFQDLNLSRNLILLNKEREKEILDYSNLTLYLDMVYLEFTEGISNDFNYQRNKTKTELVKLYNDLNNIKSHIENEEHVSIDHINFKMEDLVDAVTVRKDDVESILHVSKKSPNSILVDEKINTIKENFLEQQQVKVLKKD